MAVAPVEVSAAKAPSPEGPAGCTRSAWLDAFDGFDNLSPSELPGIVSVQNLVTSVKLNSRSFIAGTTMSKLSSPLVRTGVLISSTCESISIRL